MSGRRRYKKYRDDGGEREDFEKDEGTGREKNKK
jgi:hypothetical protein